MNIRDIVVVIYTYQKVRRHEKDTGQIRIFNVFFRGQDPAVKISNGTNVKGQNDAVAENGKIHLFCSFGCFRRSFLQAGAAKHHGRFKSGAVVDPLTGTVSFPCDFFNDGKSKPMGESVFFHGIVGETFILRFGIYHMYNQKFSTDF